MPWGSMHYLLGPVVGLSGVGVMMLISRWVWGDAQRRAHDHAAAAAPADQGLLISIASFPTRAQAEGLRQELAAAGLRGTVMDATPRPGPTRVTADGRVLPAPELLPDLRVLVFPGDADRARELLAN